MRLITCVAIASGAALFAVTAAAHGPNLVENGDFDASLAGWFEAGQLILESWSDAFDVEGSPTSGSVRQENLNDDGIMAGGIGQCVPITAGESYRFGGSTYKPSGQSAAGRAGIRLHWKSSTDCTGPDVGGLFGADGSAADFDEWYSFTSDFRVAPAGTHTAQLDLISRKDDATGTFVAYWDGLFVVPEPATMLLQSAALGALVALARRRRC